MNDDRKVTENNPELDRRIFLRRVAIDSGLAAGMIAAGFALKGEGLPLTGIAGGETGPEISAGDRVSRRDGSEIPRDQGPAPLARARSEDPRQAARLAIQALGGMEKFITRGDRVLIKPNVGWDRRAKFAANTNPDVVASVAQMCLEAGAGKVVVTDSPCNNPVRCFDKSGIKKALAEMDALVLVPTDRDYVEKDLGGEVLKTWPVLKVLFDSDVIINLPIAKHHSSAILTLGMKNWYGILGGGKRRGQLHQEMALGIAELAQYVRPHLTILDAYRILLRNGPQGGSLSDTEVKKTVIASRDPVAVDACGAGLFGLKPEEVPYIPIAVSKGLGTADLDSIEMHEVNG
ncbi:MAG: DUF362 domain-containing protein [Planctomycetota bacterium]|jgi:uncharacterized protein (DUF362 family)